MEQIVLEDIPPQLRAWLEQQQGPLLVALELDAEGRLVVQPLPGVDPQLVPRVMRTMAQYSEVLRRLA